MYVHTSKLVMHKFMYACRVSAYNNENVHLKKRVKALENENRLLKLIIIMWILIVSGS